MTLSASPSPPSVLDAGPNPPAYPASTTFVPPPHGLAALKSTFVDIQVKDGKVVAPEGWESQNMVLVRDIPGWSRKLYVNKAIVEPLRLALSRCIALGDGYVIRTLGCFAPRPKRVNGDLSTHSWGFAIDLNASTNPLAKQAGDPVVKDIPDAWVAIFESIGWTWGGRFPRADAMHFQWCSGY